MQSWLKETLIRKFSGPTSFNAGDMQVERFQLLAYTISATPFLGDSYCIGLPSITTICGRGKTVVQVSTRIKLEKKTFVVCNCFALGPSDQFQPKSRFKTN